MCCGACGFGFMPIGCMWAGAQGNLWARHACLLENCDRCNCDDRGGLERKTGYPTRLRRSPLLATASRCNSAASPSQCLQLGTCKARRRHSHGSRALPNALDRSSH